MIEITLAFIIGSFLGYILNGFLSNNTTEEIHRS